MRTRTNLAATADEAGGPAYFRRDLRACRRADRDAAEAVDGEDLGHRHAVPDGDPVEGVAVLDPVALGARPSAVAPPAESRPARSSRDFGGFFAALARVFAPTATFSRDHDLLAAGDLRSGSSEFADARDATETPCFFAMRGSVSPFFAT